MALNIGDRVIRRNGPNYFSTTLNTRGKIISIRNIGTINDPQGYQYSVPLLYCILFDNGLRECATEDQLEIDQTYVLQNYVEVEPNIISTIPIVDVVEIVPVHVFNGPFAPHIIIDDY